MATTIKVLVRDLGGNGSVSVGRMMVMRAIELMETRNPTETAIKGWGDLDGKAWDCDSAIIPDAEWRKAQA